MVRATRNLFSADREGRELPRPITKGLAIFLRHIDVAWASINRDDLLPGELVFNDSDNGLVYRLGDDTIFRYDDDATRTI